MSACRHQRFKQVVLIFLMVTLLLLLLLLLLMGAVVVVDEKQARHWVLHPRQCQGKDQAKRKPSQNKVHARLGG